LTVYLVDEPFVEIALAYAAKDSSAQMVLLQDAVYSSTKLRVSVPIYVVADDVTRRGLSSRMPPSVHTISYDGLVAMMEKERVVNFL
jgi:sulfur relay protein TusB/DsrH